MSNRSTLMTLAAGLAVVSAIMVTGAAAAQTFSSQELQGRVERVAPPHATLPGKVLCSCPQTGFFSRAVGYLNSFVNDHGTYVTVDVWCVFNGFNDSGQPVFTTACGDYGLLK